MQYIKKNVVSETLDTKYHRTTPDEQTVFSTAAKPTEYGVTQKQRQNYYYIISGLVGGHVPSVPSLPYMYVRLRQHLHAMAAELESSRPRSDDRALSQLKPLSPSLCFAVA